MKPIIHLVCDLPDSFMHNYLPQFCEDLNQMGLNASYVTDIKNLAEGEISFFISCKTIFTPEQLALHKCNVVAHPSKLPEGRGSGAVSWKILEGADEIWVSLFQPAEKLDRGDIYYQDFFTLDGSELCDEIRAKQAQLTCTLIQKFLKAYPEVPLTPQVGAGNYYQKRTPKDSELDINKSIRKQFNLLRIVDNTRYPAFFSVGENEYILRIEKKPKKIGV